jgi:hypothetical protein
MNHSITDIICIKDRQKNITDPDKDAKKMIIFASFRSRKICHSKQDIVVICEHCGKKVFVSNVSIEDCLKEDQRILGHKRGKITIECIWCGWQAASIPTEEIQSYKICIN